MRITFYDKREKSKQASENEVELLLNDFSEKIPKLIYFSITKGKPKIIINLVLAVCDRARNGNFSFLRYKENIVREIIGFKPKKARVEHDGKEIFVGFLNVDLTCPTFSIIREIIQNNQYDISEKIVTGRCVVDAGANIGLFSIWACKLGARRVYAFEPVKETFEQLEENIKLNNMTNKITAENVALGEKRCSKKINYLGGGDPCAKIENRKNNLKIQKIDVIRLDDYDFKKIPNVIKIDTEGYEENVILGSKKIIKKYKPILIFSAYHKKNDRRYLPKIITAIRNDYMFREIERDEFIINAK